MSVFVVTLLGTNSANADGVADGLYRVRFDATQRTLLPGDEFTVTVLLDNCIPPESSDSPDTPSLEAESVSGFSFGVHIPAGFEFVSASFAGTQVEGVLQGSDPTFATVVDTGVGVISVVVVLAPGGAVAIPPGEGHSLVTLTLQAPLAPLPMAELTLGNTVSTEPGRDTAGSPPQLSLSSGRVRPHSRGLWLITGPVSMAVGEAFPTPIEAEMTPLPLSGEGAGMALGAGSSGPCDLDVTDPLPTTFVTVDEAGGGNFTTIQGALDSGASNIRVLPGTYGPIVLDYTSPLLNADIVIYSDCPDPTPCSKPVIDGGGANSAITVANGTGTGSLQIGLATSENPDDYHGFEIRNGFANATSGGGGIFLNSIYKPIKIIGNEIHDNVCEVAGGGIYILDPFANPAQTVLIGLNEIHDNLMVGSNDAFGAGIMHQQAGSAGGSTATISIVKNHIHDNGFDEDQPTAVERRGGGIYSIGGNTGICNNVIDLNNAIQGGGVWVAVMEETTTRIEDNKINSNRAWDYNDDDTTVLNLTEPYQGGGIYAETGGDIGPGGYVLEIYNNFIQDNDIQTNQPYILPVGVPTDQSEIGGGIFIDFFLLDLNAVVNPVSRCELFSNIVHSNDAEGSGGGLYLDVELGAVGTTPIRRAQLFKNSFVENTLSLGAGVGSGVFVAPDCALEGSLIIVKENDPPQAQHFAACPQNANALPFRWSQLDSYAGGCPASDWELVGASSDPAGIDQADGHFRVSASPGIDNGDPGLSLPLMRDLDGDALPLDIVAIANPGASTLDKGGDEFQYRFVRGDATGDGIVTALTDGLLIMNYLFQGAAAQNCVDSMDANDDSSLNVTDGLLVFNYGFNGGPPPAPPFPACGYDATVDNLDGCIVDYTNTCDL